MLLFQHSSPENASSNRRSVVLTFPNHSRWTVFFFFWKPAWSSSLYISPPLREVINIYKSIDKRVVYCPQGWSNEAGLQLLLSSVSSKQPADEDDGVWRKRGPPAEWLINLPAKQPGLLEGTECFAEWSLKLSSGRGVAYMFRHNGWKCGFACLNSCLCVVSEWFTNLICMAILGTVTHSPSLWQQFSLSHVHLSFLQSVIFHPWTLKKIPWNETFLRRTHTFVIFRVASSLDGVIRVTLANTDVVRPSPLAWMLAIMEQLDTFKTKDFSLIWS